MARIFGRGELKKAVLIVASALGEAHGYAIMADLEGRIDGNWKASPGAVYPALLALTEAGYLRIEDRDDRRLYVVTPAGREAAARAAETTRWSTLAARFDRAEPSITVGTLLDRFAGESQYRRRLVRAGEQEAIESILTRAQREIGETLKPRTEGEDNE